MSGTTTRLIQALMFCVSVVGGASAADGRYRSPELERLTKLAQRSNDVAEVQNVMGRYAHYYMANRFKEIAELYTSKAADATYAAPTFMLVGPETIRRYFESRDDSASQGVMSEHTLATPVIEIAGDRRTAKGVWDSPGTETPGAEGPAQWAWIKYGVDFINEDGQWRIWHLKVYPTFRTTFDKSWTQTAQQHNAPSTSVATPPGATAASPVWVYSGKGTPPLDPTPPKPYQTFDVRDAYK